MQNFWLDKAKKRQDDEKETQFLKEQYGGVKLFEKRLDLVKRVITKGLYSLTKEEEKIIRQGNPQPVGLIDDLILVEDLRCWGTVLGYL